ncbi:hypothetical protein BJ322DRAFT_1216536 [Thelephora terrestris]|uniref:Uncharacterized protein n=1 Tax=Thelephora terrestris TaxID=56493 RepID=A0A9P6HNX3_9AGAM|nr:hypothetical protein BJ322DRAFT_1216536 [Thelephora terrestris]
MDPDVTEQGSPTDQNPPTDPSHVSSNPADQITDEKGAPAGEGHMDHSPDGLAETRETQDANKDTDISEGTSESIPAASPAPPTPTAKPKPKSVFVKVMELDADDMLMAWLQAFFDHYFYYDMSGGDLHGYISVDTIIYLEEQKKGGLLHLDPPISMPGGEFKFSFKSILPGNPRQRWIPEWEYDEKGEVILKRSAKRDYDDPSQLPIDWYVEGPGGQP